MVYGKYCGPYYSAGKWQGSVKYSRRNPKPVNALDRACMWHDNTYATKGGDRKVADRLFYKKTVGWNKGILSNAFGTIVGIQGALRPGISFLKKIIKCHQLNVQHQEHRHQEVELDNVLLIHHRHRAKAVVVVAVVAQKL